MTDYDASNERHIAIIRRSAKALEGAHDGLVNYIMGLVDGRAFVHDLLTYCHVFDQPFSTDPYSTAFGCGQLDVGQVLLRQIVRVCPDSYVQMTREANARDITNDARLSRSDKDSNGRDSGPDPYIHPAFDGDDSSPTTDADEGFGREGEE